MDKFFMQKPFALTTNKFRNNFLLEESISLKNANLYYNNNTDLLIVKGNLSKIIMVGYLLDITDSTLSENVILNKLLENFNKSFEEFYNYFQYINGRFTIIIDTIEDTYVFTDATSMKPLFYYENEVICTHELLINEAINDEFGIKLSKYPFKTKSFLDYTNTQEVFRFNPNMYFSFRNKMFNRYYPSVKYKVQNTDLVIENTEAYLKEQVKWLDLHYNNIYLSLTGGFDSKLSLAITKQLINKISFFSYMYRFDENQSYDELSSYRKIYYKDKVIVDNLVYNFNLHHRYFYFGDYKIPKEYLDKITNHTSSEHSYKLSYLTYKEFERDSSIHVKSTLYELAKQPFTGNADMKTSNIWMIKAMRHWSPKHIRDDFEKLEEVYQDYYKRNKLEEVTVQGYNLPMILYWEYRMANWHGNLTQETDFILETFVFINNRYMINQLMTLNKNDRVNKNYLKKIVSRFWPALNYFKANSFETLED